MSFGATRVVGETFSLAKRNLLKVAALYLVFGLAYAALSGFLAFALGTSIQVGPDGYPVGAPGAMLLLPLSQLPLLAAGLAIISLLTADATRRPKSFGGAIKDGIFQTPIFIVVSLLVAIIVGIALFIPVTVATAVLGPDSPLIVLAAALLIPFMFWINAILMPLFPGLMAEKSGLRAIPRAWALTRGYRWSIVGAFVLMGLALFAIILLAAIVIGILAGGALTSDHMTGPMLAIAILIYAGLSMLAGTVGASFQAAVYARLLDRQ